MTFPLTRLIRPSGLLGEVVETTRPLTGAYYGYNVTKTDREPIDQIHGFLAASRLSGAVTTDVPFYPLVAGLFEVVNATSLEQRASLIERNGALEERKRSIFERLLHAFQVQGHTLLTKDLWDDEAYWAAVDSILQDKSRFSRKTLLRDTLKWYENEEALAEVLTFSNALDGYDVPDRVLSRFGDWPAPLLYTPLEVAEAVFLQRKFAVSLKIGHMEERVYDKYIVESMDLVHLRQPADLKASVRRARGVTPYIDKDRRDPKIRLFFDDSESDIELRLEHVTDFSYLRTVSNVVGELYHPVADKAVLAVEAAVAAGEPTVTIAQSAVRGGMHLIEMIEDGSLRLEDVRDALPSLIVRYINEPAADRR